MFSKPHCPNWKWYLCIEDRFTEESELGRFALPGLIDINCSSQALQNRIHCLDKHPADTSELV